MLKLSAARIRRFAGATDRASAEELALALRSAAEAQRQLGQPARGLALLADADRVLASPALGGPIGSVEERRATAARVEALRGELRAALADARDGGAPAAGRLPEYPPVELDERELQEDMIRRMQKAGAPKAPLEDAPPAEFIEYGNKLRRQMLHDDARAAFAIALRKALRSGPQPCADASQAYSHLSYVQVSYHMKGQAREAEAILEEAVKEADAAGVPADDEIRRQGELALRANAYPPTYR